MITLLAQSSFLNRDLDRLELDQCIQSQLNLFMASGGLVISNLEQLPGIAYCL